MDERFRGSVSHAYQAFHGELLRFLRKHLGSSADAADLAQDTFAQWLKWPGRQSVEQPRAFLFQIARNLLRDHWRRQQSRGQDLDRPAANDEPAALEGEAAGPGERFEQQQRLSHRTTNPPRWKARRPGRASVSNSSSVSATWRAERIRFVPDCIQLTPAQADEFQWLPPTCGYRLVAEGKDLPLWHHLVCGDPERVHKERISQSGRMLSETQVAEDDWEDYLIFRAG